MARSCIEWRWGHVVPCRDLQWNRFVGRVSQKQFATPDNWIPFLLLFFSSICSYHFVAASIKCRPQWIFNENNYQLNSLRSNIDAVTQSQPEARQRESTFARWAHAIPEAHKWSTNDSKQVNEWESTRTLWVGNAYTWMVRARSSLWVHDPARMRDARLRCHRWRVFSIAFVPIWMVRVCVLRQPKVGICISHLHIDAFAYFRNQVDGARAVSYIQHTESQYTSYGYKYNTLQRQREFFFFSFSRRFALLRNLTVNWPTFYHWYWIVSYVSFAYNRTQNIYVRTRYIRGRYRHAMRRNAAHK